MSSIRVLLVDDHDLFRRGLAEVLQEEKDIEIVGEARDGREASRKASQLVPDVVFMDLNMPDQSGIETTAYLTQTWPEMKVLVLTISEEPEDLFRALGVGARGYVLKNASPGDIVDALHQVQQGWVVISPAMAPRFLSDLSQPSDRGAGSRPAEASDANRTQLTLREQEILQQVSLGLSNAEIGNKLLVSENTVKTHIKNILGKLQAKNRSEAVADATRLGFLVAGREGGSFGEG